MVNEKQAKLAIISIILSFATLLSCPFYYALWYGCIALDSVGLIGILIILGICLLTLIFGMVVKHKVKKAGTNISLKKFARFNVTISLIFGFCFFFSLTVLPNGPGIQNIYKRKTCVRQIKKIAMQVEEYIKNENKYPENLNELRNKRYRIPEFYFVSNLEDEENSIRIGGNYIYKVKTDNGKKYFVIECPKPELLKIQKSKFSCPVKCKQIKYVQGKGMIIE